MKTVKTPAASVVLFFVLFFLFLPLLVICLYSFNPDKGSFWTSGVSLKWYKVLFTESRALWIAFGNSLLIAVTSSVIATAVGTMASIGTKLFPFRERKIVSTLSYLPMVLPDVVIGISMLIFFSAMHIKLGLGTIFLAHVTFNLPFVYILVNAGLDEFNYSTIEAARDLGANNKQTLMRVIIPSIKPSILASFFMAFTLSLEDFLITFFVSGPGSTTLPLFVYSTIRYGISPVINALSFLIILCLLSIGWIARKHLKQIASNA